MTFESRPVGLHFLLLFCAAYQVHGLSLTLFNSPSSGALNWVTWPANYAYGWQENTMLMSVQRYYFVCSITDTNTPNNWLRLPYIARNGANLVYVQVAFAVRSCSSYPNQANVRNCNQYITMYYNEADSDIATTYSNGTNYPSWSTYSVAGKLVPDTPWITETIYNIKTLQLPALTRQGFYLAFQDTGSCSGIANISVYFNVCPSNTSLLASFPQTATSSDVYRFVTATGTCVPYASLVTPSITPSLLCMSDGSWQLSSQTSTALTALPCKCNNGYQPNADISACIPCGPNTYKDSSLYTCAACPALSSASGSGNSVCSCVQGYYRAPGDSNSLQCTTIPTVPLYLQSTSAGSSSVLLIWQSSTSFGGRQDGYYTVTTLPSSPQGNTFLAAYCGVAGNAVVTGTTITVTGLFPATNYYFLVCACNGVSTLATQANCALTSAQTLAWNSTLLQTTVAVTAGPTVWQTSSPLVGYLSGTGASDSSSAVVIAVVTVVSVLVAIGATILLVFLIRRKKSPGMPCFDKAKEALGDHETLQSNGIYTAESPARTNSPLPSPANVATVQPSALLRAASSKQSASIGSDQFSASATPSILLTIQSRQHGDSTLVAQPSLSSQPNGIQPTAHAIGNQAHGSNDFMLASQHATVANQTSMHNAYAPPGGPCIAARSLSGAQGTYSADIVWPFHTAASLTSPPSSLNTMLQTVAHTCYDTLRYDTSRTNRRNDAQLAVFNGYVTNEYECKNADTSAMPYTISGTSVSDEPSVVHTNSTLQPVANGASANASEQNYADPALMTREISVQHIAVESVIGSGEFGEVCKGRLTYHLPNGSTADRFVALKTLKTSASTLSRGEFLSEASIMCMFEHENILRLEGVVTKSNPLMIVSEFMENGSLDAFLRANDCKLSNYVLVQMLQGVASGMDYLASKSYVHRDLAARNILVNRRLVCKIGDFGLSRQTVLLNETSSCCYVTRGGKIPVRWTAPEAILFRKFTTGSDVWSFGIVMWEVISYGNRPYWDWSNGDVIRLVELGYRLPPPFNCPEVSYNTMLQCWQKDRHLRPSFQSIYSELSSWLQNPDVLKRIISKFPACLEVPEDFEPTTITTAHVLSKAISGSVRSSIVNDLVPLPLTVNEWLLLSELAEHSHRFEQARVLSMKSVLCLHVYDLANIGIQAAVEQKRLLSSIQNLQLFRKFYKLQSNNQHTLDLRTLINSSHSLSSLEEESDESFHQLLNSLTGVQQQHQPLKMAPNVAHNQLAKVDDTLSDSSHHYFSYYKFAPSGNDSTPSQLSEVNQSVQFGEKPANKANSFATALASRNSRSDSQNSRLPKDSDCMV